MFYHLSIPFVFFLTIMIAAAGIMAFDDVDDRTPARTTGTSLRRQGEQRGRGSSSEFYSRDYYQAMMMMAATAATTSAEGFIRDIPVKCPSSDEIQSDVVKTHYQKHALVGYYYELACTDPTQPPICSCQTTNYTLNDDETIFLDQFTIDCLGNIFVSNLQLAITDIPGVMIATWEAPVLNRIAFPNTIVDVHEDEDGQYDWFIEFLCIDDDDDDGNTTNTSTNTTTTTTSSSSSSAGARTAGNGGGDSIRRRTSRPQQHSTIRFYACNFYSRIYDPNTSNQLIATMVASARQQGLGPFLDAKQGVHVVNQTGCIK